MDTSYTYYLGNVGVYNTEQDTTIAAYTNERKSTVCGSGITYNTHTNNCYIWYGNKATWNGNVALLYPSDYGYSASSTYWSGTNLYNYDVVAYNTSWMQTTANHSKYEWFLSPSSFGIKGTASWSLTGAVGDYYYIYGGYGTYAVRPCLNLLSTAPIDANHQGTEADPYVLITE